MRLTKHKAAVIFLATTCIITVTAALLLTKAPAAHRLTSSPVQLAALETKAPTPRLALHSQVPSTSHKADSTPRPTRTVAACSGSCGDTKKCPEACKGGCGGPSGCSNNNTCTCFP
jgi:hypothetical protein